MKENPRSMENQQELEIRQYESRLFPLNRSLTGDGVRETYKILNEISPFDVKEIPSGTKVFDWEVPKEWKVNQAYIEVDGNRIIDFKNNNLHLVGYSTPTDQLLTYKELEPHLLTDPTKPEVIPYRTSYYKDDWGFCMKDWDKRLLKKDAKYHAVVDTELFDGSMTLGEKVIKGKSSQEYIISTYSCHPSMANDNLSGMLTWAFLMRELSSKKNHFTYRFIIGPETIGALTHLKSMDHYKVKGAFAICTTAGSGEHSFKETFKGNDDLDRATRLAFRDLKVEAKVYPFDVKGSDERQFSSQAFRIPTIGIYKGKYYEEYNYHTSRDNRLNTGGLLDNLEIYKYVIESLESNKKYESVYKEGEPMLGKRDLYPNVGGLLRDGKPSRIFNENKRDFKVGKVEYGNPVDAMLWVLFYADGKTSLIDIAEKTSFPVRQLSESALTLKEKGLLK